MPRTIRRHHRHVQHHRQRTNRHTTTPRHHHLGHRTTSHTTRTQELPIHRRVPRPSLQQPSRRHRHDLGIVIRIRLAGSTSRCRLDGHDQCTVVVAESQRRRHDERRRPLDRDDFGALRAGADDDHVAGSEASGVRHSERGTPRPPGVGGTARVESGCDTRLGTRCTSRHVFGRAGVGLGRVGLGLDRTLDDLAGRRRSDVGGTVGRSYRGRQRRRRLHRNVDGGPLAEALLLQRRRRDGPVGADDGQSGIGPDDRWSSVGVAERDTTSPDVRLRPRRRLERERLHDLFDHLGAEHDTERLDQAVLQTPTDLHETAVPVDVEVPCGRPPRLALVVSHDPRAGSVRRELQPGLPLELLADEVETTGTAVVGGPGHGVTVLTG